MRGSTGKGGGDVIKRQGTGRLGEHRPPPGRNAGAAPSRRPQPSGNPLGQHPRLRSLGYSLQGNGVLPDDLRKGAPSGLLSTPKIYAQGLTPGTSEYDPT